MEFVLGLLLFLLVAVGIIGWLWIVVLAFSEDEPLWGIGCLIISPLCIVYGFQNFQEAKIPTLMVCVGFATNIGIRLLAGLVGA
ncbi:putative membrane protein [Rhodopirellula maiorica SM1]|uniref:Putative membrane protein n=1 Tax=Rhodopirellula maiorica SM1 TaxID=1265738 RepID=M5RTD8_9BACT|nr:hypothetical protein [Rhodopirellula maiorica]EMI22608.1 putative membrane protein [Rhodopirellula maiorica SM1]